MRLQIYGPKFDLPPDFVLLRIRLTGSDTNQAAYNFSHHNYEAIQFPGTVRNVVVQMDAGWSFCLWIYISLELNSYEFLMLVEVFHHMKVSCLLNFDSDLWKESILKVSSSSVSHDYCCKWQWVVYHELLGGQSFPNGHL